jgi:hypothetical protein
MGAFGRLRRDEQINHDGVLISTPLHKSSELIHMWDDKVIRPEDDP